MRLPLSCQENVISSAFSLFYPQTRVKVVCFDEPLRSSTTIPFHKWLYKRNTESRIVTNRIVSTDVETDMSMFIPITTHLLRPDHHRSNLWFVDGFPTRCFEIAYSFIHRRMYSLCSKSAEREYRRNEISTPEIAITNYVFYLTSCTDEELPVLIGTNAPQYHRQVRLKQIERLPLFLQNSFHLKSPSQKKIKYIKR